MGCPSGPVHLVGRSPLGGRLRASLPAPGASAWFGGGSRPGSGSGRERPDILLSEACRLRAGARAPSPRPARPGSGSPSERERSKFDPGLGCSGAPVARAPRELPGGHRVPEANLESVWRPSGWSVGIGATAAPAVSAGSRGEPASLHDIRTVRPDLRTGGSEPRGVRVHPPGAVPAARPLGPEGPRGSSTGGCRPSRGPGPGSLGARTCSAAGRNPPEAGREVREILRSSAPASRRLETVSESDSLHLRRNRGVHSAPACDRRIPPASASGRIRKLRRLLRTCAGSAPFLGAWWFGGTGGREGRPGRTLPASAPRGRGPRAEPTPEGEFPGVAGTCRPKPTFLARAFRPKPWGSHTRSRP